MIKKITIKNFRSWKELDIELSPRINVFIGNSGSGKSNFNRALDWLINNRPTGDKYRSRWALRNEKERGKINSTVVKLITKEGYIITRKKNKEDNLYRIKYEGEIEELRAFGFNVPKEISSILNIQEINTQFQFDPYFLLGFSPSEVSKYLNKIANLSIIDRSNSEIKKLEFRIRTNLNSLNSEFKRLNGDLKNLSFVETAEEELIRIERKEIIINKLNFKKKTIETLIENINKNNEILEKFPVNESLLELNTLLNKLEELNKNNEENKLKELKNLLNKISSIKCKLKKIPTNLENLVSKTNKFLEEKTIIEKIENKKEELNEIINKIKLLKNNQRKELTEIGTLTKELKKYKTCPLCGEKRDER